MKASLSNLTGLPNAHRGCAEGSPEGLISSIEEYRIQNGASRERAKRESVLESLARIGLGCSGSSRSGPCGDSLLNQSWVSSTLGVLCVHAT